MRYRKGSIAISDSRDIPALKLVRDCRAISLSQAQRELLLANLEKDKRSIAWRLSRLVEAGLLSILEHQRAIGELVYAITSEGLELLESRGLTILSLNSSTEIIIHPKQVQHVLELNAIRLALKEAGLLVHWKNELQIVSENLVSGCDAQKDYDAIVTMNYSSKRVQFALEYERSAKASARYKDITRAIARDESTDLVLYLASNRELLLLLAHEFDSLGDKVVMGLSGNFRRQLLDTPVFVNAEPESDFYSFSSILDQLPERNQDDLELIPLSI